MLGTITLALPDGVRSIMTIPTQTAPDQLWYTRCPVPTASGIAYDLGWLGRYYTEEGIAIGILQDAPLEIARHHYDHDLPGLIREGGNVPAIVARSAGAPTRLIGLTWIDERQAIVVRADDDLRQPAQLAGRRIAVPGWAAERHASHRRAMALGGFSAALKQGGLALVDVSVVEIPTGATVPPGRLRERRAKAEWAGVEWVAQGLADAAYVKGAAGIEAARQAGLTIAIDLDALPDRRARVNNGTPRPLTVHDALLQSRPEWVAAFLEQTLRAAGWAAGHEAEVRAILARETGAGAEGVDAAYAPGFHTALAPDLSAQRLELLGEQIDFLARNDFLAGPVDLAHWVEPGPLREARQAIVRGAVTA
jgi:ABC-type nitrate/sulfonate/bicarbonate transport system substrate-binding protein